MSCDLQAVLRSLQDYGHIYRVPAGLRDDPRIVEAVKKLVLQDPLFLQNAPEWVRGSAAVVRAALGQWPTTTLQALKMRLIPDAVCQDPELWKAVVAQDGRALRHAPDAVRADAVVVRLAVQQCAGALQYAVCQDPELWKALVAQDGRALRHAPDAVRADAVVVRLAVQQCAGALEFAAGALRHDAEIVALAARWDPAVLLLAPTAVRSGLVDWAALAAARVSELPAWARLGASELHGRARRVLAEAAQGRDATHMEVPLALAERCGVAAPELQVLRSAMAQWRCEAALAACCEQKRWAELPELAAAAEQAQCPAAARRKALEQCADQDAPASAKALLEAALAAEAAEAENAPEPPELESAKLEPVAELESEKPEPVAELESEKVEPARAGEDTKAAPLSALFASLAPKDPQAKAKPGVAAGSAVQVAKQKQALRQAPARTAEQVLASSLPTRTPVHSDLAAGLCAALARTDFAVEPEVLSGLFDARATRVYSLEPGSYGLRGGRPYMKPAGWVRFGVKCEHKQDWCVCYHGTDVKSALSILSRGLKRPGADGVKVAHGQAGSESKKTIYVTPSIEYAAFPTYGTFFELGSGRWAQVVLQCRIRPDAFEEQSGTLGNKFWPQELPFDPQFPSLQGLEWLCDDEDALQVTGLMVREFGAGARADVYGPCAAKVQDSVCPQFEWTRLRQEEMRAAVAA